MDPEYLLTLSCPDQRGIVHAVTGFLAAHACNILDSQQYGDRQTGRFFLRIHVAAEAPHEPSDALRAAFANLASDFQMAWDLHDPANRDRVLILVSREGHCLNDLLFRARSGTLRADVVAVVSNHEDFRSLSTSYDVPFHHIPVTTSTKPDAELELRRLLDEYAVDLSVLARYMQVLSPELAGHLTGRAINIHHGLLPSFRGPRPYHQAHERGVKLIGATAHYVTAGLDEGPIIEQEVSRIDHALEPEELVAVGRDLECVALARAVRWHLERRVLLNGVRTVVFR
ncbi:MAG TPA: formyltetrahydrofolate deformylase [Mycobacteriales bacterium]|nr:formyltetrahydrofolate deformylase [Mycobacteriales bacterium]